MSRKKVISNTSNRFFCDGFDKRVVPISWQCAANLRKLGRNEQLRTRPLFTTAHVAFQNTGNIFNTRADDDAEISESIDALFSDDANRQMKACKAIADLLSLPPSLPDEVHANISDPEHDSLRRLWTSIFDEVDEGKSLADAASAFAARAEAVAVSGEDEEDAVVGASLTFGEIDFDAMALLFRAVRAMGGLREPGGVFWDLGAGPGRPALAAALLHDFDAVRGIELQEAVHARAHRALEAFHRAGGAASRQTQVRCLSQPRPAPPGPGRRADPGP